MQIKAVNHTRLNQKETGGHHYGDSKAVELMVAVPPSHAPISDQSLWSMCIDFLASDIHQVTSQLGQRNLTEHLRLNQLWPIKEQATFCVVKLWHWWLNHYLNNSLYKLLQLHLWMSAILCLSPHNRSCSGHLSHAGSQGVCRGTGHTQNASQRQGTHQPTVAGNPNPAVPASSKFSILPALW